MPLKELGAMVHDEARLRDMPRSRRNTRPGPKLERDMGKTHTFADGNLGCGG